MQVDFTPVDQWQAPKSAQNAAPPAPQPPSFGEEARTAGLYRVKGQGLFTKSQAAPSSFSQAMSGTQNAPPGEAPSFGDFLDMVNPLQHIPLVNLAYRGLTGDEIGPAAQIVGGAIFGGPIGAIAGTASAIVEYQTGSSITDTALSAFTGKPLAKASHATAVFHDAPVIKRYNFNQSV